MTCHSQHAMWPIANLVFRLDLPHGAEQTYYMRLKSASPLVFPLTLLDRRGAGAEGPAGSFVFGTFLWCHAHHGRL